MAGLFSGFSITTTPLPPSLLDKKEGQVVPIHVVAGETSFRGGNNMCKEEIGEMELDPEFKSVEHPMEPIDEGRPVKCPTNSYAGYVPGHMENAICSKLIQGGRSVSSQSRNYF